MSTKTKILLAFIVVGLLLTAFSLGYGYGLVDDPADPAFASVQQAWNIILSDYVENYDIDTEELSQAAIEGMLQLLDDPYTTYLDSDTYQSSLNDLAGEFEGIGATVSTNDEGQIEIIAPLADSPAAEAGIQPGDIILEIDGQSTEGLSLYEAILKIRGHKGTSVTLTVLHTDETVPVEIMIIRDIIELDSVYLEMAGDIAVIEITEFNDRTNEELGLTLQTIAEANAAGIVIDLRSNPGGLLSAVVDVASRFLEEGLVVTSVRYNDGYTEVLEANKQSVTTDLPMVVLVDEYSASGSEVLSGALQGHGRAVIAGTTTYGKGSVNYLEGLVDGSGIYITAARWLTPGGEMIEGQGIAPDIELELEGYEAIQWAVDYLHGDS